MKLAVIGLGGRITSLIDVFKKYDNNFQLTAVSDIRNEDIKLELIKKDINISNTSFYTDADEMLSANNFDGVAIGTICSLHAEMAIKVIKKGKALFLEKPVATNAEDLSRLNSTYKIYNEMRDKILVSFPLRGTPLFKMVKEIIDSGKIGTVEHVQAINNVPYGGIYFHRNMYRDEHITGGMFLQKATHDFDYINKILGIRPTVICAMTSKQIFKGNRPKGLKCIDCKETEECPESKKNLALNAQFPYETTRGEYCCFATDTGNEDSGSAIIRYETGMHVVYTQNFVARKRAGKRGARFIGYKGTLEFDFLTGEIKVYMHTTPRVETYKVEAANDIHFGGDITLVRNFIGIAEGREKSTIPLDDGIISALMCIKAKESENNRTFQKIEFT